MNYTLKVVTPFNDVHKKGVNYKKGDMLEVSEDRALELFSNKNHLVQYISRKNDNSNKNKSHESDDGKTNKDEKPDDGKTNKDEKPDDGKTNKDEKPDDGKINKDEKQDDDK